MKRFLLAFFFLAFTANLSAQGFKIDTVVNESWTNNSWQLSDRIINTYNGGCQLVSTTIQQRLGTEWVNQGRFNYTYASGDNISQLITQLWNTDTKSWDNISRITYTYNGSFKVVTSISDQWMSGDWQTAARVTNTYDANGYLSSTLNELSLGGGWLNQSLYTYTNNPDGTVNIEVTQNWDFITSVWQNITRKTYSYNANKSEHQSVTETWTGTAWVNFERDTYTYDAQGRELTDLLENWVNNAWVNKTLTTTTINGSGQPTVILEQTWDANSWKNQSQTNLTYNGDGSLYQSVEQIANEALTTLNNNSRNTFHYTTNCILPLTLLDFSATLSGKDVLLQWTTAKEINTSHFDIESSTDGASFRKLGTLKSVNNTQKTSYDFTDANPAGLANGKMFYRLRIVDKDGKFSYSRVAFIGLPQNAGSFSVFPTVVKNNLFVVYNAPASGKTGIRIIDGLGRQVYSQQLSNQQTGNQTSINVTNLKTGVYHIQLITKDGSHSAKFLKQ